MAGEHGEGGSDRQVDTSSLVLIHRDGSFWRLMLLTVMWGSSSLSRMVPRTSFIPAYFSHRLSPAERNYNVCNCELLVNIGRREKLAGRRYSPFHSLD